MMGLKDVMVAAAAIGNQMKAGIPISDIVERMVRVQPKHAIYWRQAAVNIKAGQPLSLQIEGQWPENIVSAVKAGELAGTMDDVFDRIEETITLQLKIRGLIGKMAYPVGLGAAGILVFLFFMTQVLPALSASLGKSDSFVFQLSTYLTEVFSDYLWYIVLAVIGSISGVVWFFSNAGNRERVVDASLNLPILGEALTSLYFGLWSYYVAMMSAAGGISVDKVMVMASAALPPTLRLGVDLAASEVIQRGLAEAVEAEKQAEGDPRRKWPFYIGNAFVVAQQTGLLDRELMRIAPSMIKDGINRLETFLQVANIIALAFSAFLIVSPLMAYYIQLGKTFQKAMSG